VNFNAGVAMKRSVCCLLAGLFVSGSSVAARAESDFYQGKQLRLVVGYNVANDYDVGARLLAKYLPKYIPGHPTIVVQNMPQAASIVAANYVYAQAPRDGTVVGTFSRNFPSQALMGQAKVTADPRRFVWLGATSYPARICVVGKHARVQKLADVFTHELIVGSLGAASSNSILPTVFNHVLGTKFRIIEGYKGTQEIVLAVERGELEGSCASLGQYRSSERMFRDGTLHAILRAEEVPIPGMSDVPSIYEYAKTEEQRQFMRFVFSSVEFGRPYAFPPDTPKDRVALMRRAIAETVKDRELMAEADKMGLDMSYRSPEHLERLVAKLYETPREVIEAVKKLVPAVQ
jgi:tripartite-type tricarboxylate transporter receptor subunit TctC